MKCKCCGRSTKILGNVNFSKSCQDRHGVKVFEESPVEVTYRRCESCGFIFTTLCDDWSPEDFKAKIYNADYCKADGVIPGTEGRDLGYESGLEIAHHLKGSEENISILDFGSGGNPGSFGKALIEKGFNVTSYDPFRSDVKDIKPNKKFDFVLSIEVFEHCHDLEEVLKKLDKHTKENSMILFSTMLHQNVPEPEQLVS